MSFTHIEKNNESQPYLDVDAKGGLHLGKQLGNQHLTAREIDILKCLLKGYSAKEAGLELKISYRTVESYINTLKLKLGCTRKSELIGFCIKLELFRFLS